MPTHRDINEANIVQEGLNTLADDQSATEGQVPTVGSDGAVAFAAGGGGGLTAVYAAYHGNNVSIANGAQVHLTWNGFDGGTELFDRTDTEKPTVLASGVYIVSVNVLGSGMTAGGSYFANLLLDGQGEAIEFVSETGAAIDGVGQPTLTISGAYYIPLGGTVEAEVKNFDGVGARNFRIASATAIRLA